MGRAVFSFSPRRDQDNMCAMQGKTSNRER
jgi:hypothetical protein